MHKPTKPSKIIHVLSNASSKTKMLKEEAKMFNWYRKCFKKYLFKVSIQEQNSYADKVECKSSGLLT